MLYDLLHLDLDGWHPREHVPQTKALLDQKMLGMTGLEQWYVHLLSVGELPKPKPEEPTLGSLPKSLIEDAKNHSPRNKYITPEELAAIREGDGLHAQEQWQKMGLDIPAARRSPLKLARQSRQHWEWLADIEDWGEKPRLRKVRDWQDSKFDRFDSMSCAENLKAQPMPSDLVLSNLSNHIKPIKHKNRVET